MIGSTGMGRMASGDFYERLSRRYAFFLTTNDLPKTQKLRAVHVFVVNKKIIFIPDITPAVEDKAYIENFKVNTPGNL